MPIKSFCFLRFCKNISAAYRRRGYPSGLSASAGYLIITVTYFLSSVKAAMRQVFIDGEVTDKVAA
jgi:hypothetical protein